MWINFSVHFIAFQSRQLKEKHKYRTFEAERKQAIGRIGWLSSQIKRITRMTGYVWEKGTKGAQQLFEHARDAFSRISAN